LNVSADLSGLIYQTRAIVLRTIKYGETSLIVDMFTEQKGHQTFIINSVRKPKATTPASSLQLLSLLELVAYFHENRKINRIKEARPEYIWKSIPFDRRKSAVITCLAEVCAKCMTTADPHPELFAWLNESLVAYDHPEEYDRDFLIRFLVDLSHYLGFGLEINMDKPNARYFDLQEGQLVDTLPFHPYVMEMQDYDALCAIIQAGATGRSAVSLDTRRRLADILTLYYQLHVESLKEINSLKILRELL
jgi:DNA repair protein RecO (recombination protein O)